MRIVFRPAPAFAIVGGHAGRASETIRGLWAGPGGGREVLTLAYPLILAHMSFTVQTFVDRLFLTWYSAEAVAERSPGSSPPSP